MTGTRGVAQTIVEYALLITALVLVVLLVTWRHGQVISQWFYGLAARVTTTGG